MAGKKVFLSFASEDQGRVPPLLAAFAAWDVRATLLDPTRQPPDHLLPETAQQIRECAVYLRLCTGATRHSAQVALADAAFRTLLEADDRQGRADRRRLVNVILDPAYTPNEQDKATLYIDTAGKTRALWLEELAFPLGVATLQQRVSRRALLGMGVGAVLTLGSSGAAATIYLQQQAQQRAARQILANAKNVSGQPKWMIPLGEFNNQKNIATQLFDDDGTLYAVASGATGSGIFRTGVYALSAPAASARLIRFALATDVTLDPTSFSVAGGLIFLTYFDTNGAAHPSAFHASTGAFAFAIQSGGYTPPIVVDASVYCITSSATDGSAFVSAFDRSTGAVRWQRPIFVRAFDLNVLDTSNPLAVVNGAVYASIFEHILVCYDAATGHEKWQFLARAQLTAPVIVGGTAYVGARDGSVYALDAATGAEHWRGAADDGILAPLVVSDGTVYAGSEQGNVYAFDAGTGARYWQSALGNVQTNVFTNKIGFPPALYRNVIAVAARDILFAFDLRDGSPRWQYEPLAGSSYPLSQPLIYQGLILVGSPDGKVYAVNP